MDLRGAVLAGWSYGTAVVGDYLATYGTRDLAGIVLIGGVTGLGRPVAAGLGPDFVAVTRRMIRADPDDAAGRAAALGEFVDLTTAAPLPDAEREEFRGWSAQVPPHVVAGMLRRTEDYEPVLRAVDVPTLVLHGTEDRVMLPVLGRRLAEMVPGARLVEYPGIGHMPFWEEPDRVNDDLTRFLDSLDSLDTLDT